MMRHHGLHKIVPCGHQHRRHRQKKRKFKRGRTRHAGHLAGRDCGHGTGRSREHGRKNLRSADPDGLRQTHLLHVHHARSRKSGVNDPHDHSANEKRPAHYPEAFQVLADLLRQSPCRNCGDHKCYQRETQRMGQYGAITPFASRERAKKFQNSIAKIDRQRQDRAQLNDDRVHLPKTVMQIDAQ